MKIDRDREDDAIYLEFTPKKAVRTEMLNEQLIVDYDDSGSVTGVEVLAVSDGVDLDGLTPDLEMRVGRVLEEQNVRLLAH